LVQELRSLVGDKARENVIAAAGGEADH